MKKIKKITIKAEKGGMIMPKPNEVLKQSITIKNNGQMWWTAYRMLTQKERDHGFASDLVKISEYKNIGAKNAEDILRKAEEVLTNKINPEFTILVADAILDEVFIEYDNGETLSGQLCDLTYNLDDVEQFYGYISKKVLIKDVLLFEI